MATVRYAIFLTIYGISANQEKCQNVFLERERQCQRVEKLDLRYSTENSRIYVGFFQHLATWQHTFMQKVTNTVIYAHR